MHRAQLAQRRVVLGANPDVNPVTLPHQRLRQSNADGARGSVTKDTRF